VDRRFKVAPTQHAEYNEPGGEEDRKKDEEKIKERNRSLRNYYEELRKMFKTVMI